MDTAEEDPLASVAGASLAKWSARYDNARYDATLIQTISYDELAITLALRPADPGVTFLRYAADPSDIGTASGRMLAAFEREI